MFALPGVLALLVFVYLRPQEFSEQLKSFPGLYVSFGLAIFGLLVDVRQGHTRVTAAPQLAPALALYAWFLLTIGLRAPAAFASEGVSFLIAIAIYAVVAHGVETFRAFQALASTVLTMVLWVSFVGVHQHFQPTQCIQMDQANMEGRGRPDGRECETVTDCEQNDPEPGASYACENVGLVGTTSIGGGRVRYRGVLNDPNELALVASAGVPFAYAFRERSRTVGRALLVVATFVLVGLCTLYTKSRGGQLVFLAVLGAYFVRRYGWKGLALAGVAALPVLLLGGRSGEEAEASTRERLECWYEGMTMWKSSPIFGVGGGQFTEHHYLTAHNSYVLILGELGSVGFYLWTAVLWATVKVPVTAVRRYAGVPGAEVAATWGMALVAAWSGLLLGIFFLSFAYKHVLWIYIGLTGAFHGAARRHDPEFRVRLGARDAAALAAVNVALTLGLFVYTRLRAP
jgi:hypothetical protein